MLSPNAKARAAKRKPATQLSIPGILRPPTPVEIRAEVRRRLEHFDVRQQARAQKRKSKRDGRPVR